MYKRYRTFISDIIAIGVDKEPDVKLHDYIRHTNLLMACNCLIHLTVGIFLFIFIHNPLCASCSILSAFALSTVIYFNHIGYNLFGRVFIYLYADSALLIFSVVFSHKTYLDTYAIIISISSVMLFSKKEWKWLLLTYVVSISVIIIEYTPLENYLPNLHLLKETEAVNNIILGGLIGLLLAHAGTYAYIQKQAQNILIETKNKLAKANEELHEYSEDLEVFSMAVTHDLKSPMSIARMFIQMIQKQIEKEPLDIESIKENTQQIAASAEKMSTLLLSYLSYMKVLHPGYRKEYISVNEELHALAANLAKIYPSAEIELPEKDITLQYNKFMFLSIFQNLVENALKYNHSIKPVVVVEMNNSSNEINFKIKDNGQGINQHFRDKIFVPFNRFHKNIDGSGIGLTIAKKSALKLGGDLICEDSSPEGTTFILTLPIT